MNRSAVVSALDLALALALALVLAFECSALAGGLVVTEENDLFMRKDDNYTQGLDVSLTREVPGPGGETVGEARGLRSRMYTPADISDPTNQPGDRPWAGLTTAYYERTERSRDGSFTEGWELGTLGPESGTEWMQKTVHAWTGSAAPMGWSNQVPNEPSAQWYRGWRESLWEAGGKGGLAAELEGPYGWCLGTTYDYVRGGLAVRAGWNLPEWRGGGGIVPKMERTFAGGLFGFVFAEGEARYVLHNATLGHSFFSRGNSMWDRELVPVVGSWEYGARAGWRCFSLEYAEEFRTDEFAGQPEPFECGRVRVSFGTDF